VELTIVVVGLVVLKKVEVDNEDGSENAGGIYS
jgi:hypothetical protein